MELSRYGSGKHPLFVGCIVISWICSAIIDLHVSEEEFLRHLYKHDRVNEWGVSIAMWQTLLEWSWYFRDSLDYGFHPCQLLRHSFI